MKKLEKKEKKIIIIIAIILALLIIATTLLVVLLNGNDEAAILNVEGATDVVVDNVNNVVNCSVGSDVSALEISKLISSEGVKLVLYSDPECTIEVTELDLQEGVNKFYAKVTEDGADISKEDKEKVWTIIINKAAAAAPVITGIAIKDVKTLYKRGDEFGTGTITVTYNNNTTADVNITVSNVTGFDTGSVGTKSITVTYNGFTVTYSIVVENSVINLYDYLEEFSDVGATYLCGLQGASYQDSYDYIYSMLSSDDIEMVNYFESLSNTLTLAGISDQQIIDFIAIQKDDLYPIVYDIFSKMMEDDSELAMMETLVNEDMLNSLTSLLSKFMNVFDANDITNIIMELDVDILTGNYFRDSDQTVTYCADTIAGIAGGMSLSIIENFYNKIATDTDGIYDIGTFTDRAEVLSIVTSEYNLMNDLVESDKSEFISNFNLLYVLINYSEDEAMDMYPIEDIVPAINYLGDMLAVLSDSFVITGIIDTVSDTFALSDDDSRTGAAILFLGNDTKYLISLFADVAQNVEAGDITDILNYYSDGENAANEAEEDSAACKLVVKICRLINESWDPLTSTEKAGITAWINEYYEISEDITGVGTSIVAYMLEMAQYDENNLSTEAIDTIIARTTDIQEILDEETAVYPYIEVSGGELLIEKGTDLIGMKTEVEEVFEFYFVLNDNNRYSFDVSTALLNGLDSSTTGYKYFTITTNGISKQVGYFVYDENTEIEFLEFTSNSVYNYIVKDGTFASLNNLQCYITYRITETGYTDSYELEKMVTIYNQSELLLSEGTSTVGRYTGFYIANDNFLLGDIYIPFVYYVFDNDAIIPLEILDVSMDTLFAEGQALSGDIRVLYNNGTDNVEITTENAVLSADKKTVTITIGALTKVVDVTVIATADATLVTALEVETKKTLFKVGDVIDSSNFDVTAILGYGCDIVEDVTAYAINYSTEAEGVSNLTITYEGCTYSQEITVISVAYAATVTKFEVYGDMQSGNNYDEKFLVTQALGYHYTTNDDEYYAVVTYGGGYSYLYYETEEALTSDGNVTNDFSSAASGVYKLYFYYKNTTDNTDTKSYTYNYYYIYTQEQADEVTEIDFTINSGYYVGETLGYSLTYDTNFYKNINVDSDDADLAITGYDSSNAGVCNIVVTYRGFTVTETMRITAPEEDYILQSLLCPVYAVKTIYTLNEVYSPATVNIICVRGRSTDSSHYSYVIDYIENFSTATVGTFYYTINIKAYYEDLANGITVDEDVEVRVYYTVIDSLT